MKVDNKLEAKEIPGTIGKYYIHPEGRVYSTARRKFLVAYPNSWGYLNLRIKLRGKFVMRKVHRLVAEAFVLRAEGKNEVNHKDGNKLNNHYTNLEWVTSSENKLHSVHSLGYRPAGNLKNKRVPDSALEDIVALRKQGDSLPSIGKKYGVGGTAIWNILKRKYGKTTF